MIYSSGMVGSNEDLRQVTHESSSFYMTYTDRYGKD